MISCLGCFNTSITVHSSSYHSFKGRAKTEMGQLWNFCSILILSKIKTWASYCFYCGIFCCFKQFDISFDSWWGGWYSKSYVQEAPTEKVYKSAPCSCTLSINLPPVLVPSLPLLSQCVTVATQTQTFYLTSWVLLGNFMYNNMGLLHSAGEGFLHKLFLMRSELIKSFFLVVRSKL